MPELPPNYGTALMPCVLGLLLVSCAARPAQQISTLPEQMAAPKGVIIPGVVVAIRPITAQDPLSAGATEVLAALQIPPPATAPNATEFVIQRSDGNVASIVVRSPASSPGAAMSAANFAVGDQVELITGQQTELIHRTP